VEKRRLVFHAHTPIPPHSDTFILFSMVNLLRMDARELPISRRFPSISKLNAIAAKFSLLEALPSESPD
jgi:hypothetical protein